MCENGKLPFADFCAPAGKLKMPFWVMQRATDAAGSVVNLCSTCSKLACLDWAVCLACGNAGYSFLFETVKVFTCLFKVQWSSTQNTETPGLENQLLLLLSWTRCCHNRQRHSHWWAPAPSATERWFPVYSVQSHYCALLGCEAKSHKIQHCFNKTHQSVKPMGWMIPDICIPHMGDGDFWNYKIDRCVCERVRESPLSQLILRLQKRRILLH